MIRDRDVLEESTTYQAIFRKGVAQGIASSWLRAILRIGTNRFGTPSEAIKDKLQRMTDVLALEAILDRILVAANWDDLLDDVQPNFVVVSTTTQE